MRLGRRRTIPLESGLQLYGNHAPASNACSPPPRPRTPRARCGYWPRVPGNGPKVGLRREGHAACCRAMLPRPTRHRGWRRGSSRRVGAGDRFAPGPHGGRAG
jgi:hypothetical protein